MMRVLVVGIASLLAAGIVAAPNAVADTGLECLGQPVSGPHVSVTRCGGGVEEFEVRDSGTSHATIWHRGGAGDWEQVTDHYVGPKDWGLTAAEDVDGTLEVFAVFQGGLFHVRQDRDGHWGRAEEFGIGKIPYFGGPFVYREFDGRLDLFSSDSNDRIVHILQEVPGGEWGSKRALDQFQNLPPNRVLTAPGKVRQLPDGKLDAVAILWGSSGSAPEDYWHAVQFTPHGDWGAWQACASIGCD
ncbi:hypothetical protein GCM10010174_06100 [Kutzneria viridogrisea]|uniref:Uncharacterized protein n=1 Tax=Kutzneria viridogrisea TaxID=47990 RepID=A0ABR6BBW2_9PSEU|nr:hypothetical protein [Kutzneria viridogrisea]